MLKNKLFRVILALSVAMCMYAYVITFVSSEREETFYDIPVSYQGEALLNERSLMVTSEAKPTVNLTLYGKRSELRKLSGENITILADLSKIGSPGSHSLTYNIYFPGDIPDNAFSVISQYPTMVKVDVERRITKEIPVVVRYDGRVPEGHMVDTQNVELDRQTVTVTGPASAMDQIQKAIVNVDLENRTASFSETYRFTLSDENNAPVDAKMVQTNAAEVSVTLYIDRVMEIPLTLTVVDGGGATEETSQITIEPSVIKVSGSESQLEQLGESLILGQVNLAELRGDTTMKLPITLPEGLENISGITDAMITIKFPELMIRNITVGNENFEALNVPEGLEAVFITSEIVVTVRGPKALVTRMTADNILITVDFADKPVGSVTEKAGVIMGEGFTDAGAIGVYRVVATIQEKLPEQLP